MEVKKIRWRFGIRSRMLLVTFALGTLFVLYVATSTAEQARRERTHVREQMRLVAAVAGAHMDDHIGDLDGFLGRTGAALPIDPSAGNDALLRAAVAAADRPDGVLAVSVWALDGKSLGSSAGGRVRSAAGRPFFAAALRDGGLQAEAPVRTSESAEWTAEFALPVVREGVTVAVISATTRLRSLAEVVQLGNALPEGAILSVLAGDGRFIARSRDAERFIGQPAPVEPGLIERRLTEGSGSSETTAADGMTRIFGFVRVRTLPWMVYVGIPVETALAPARAATQRSLLLGLAMLAAGLFIAAWVAGRIARPLRQLSADARLIGEGRFEHRSQVKTSSEIGLLAHTLNRMAGLLEDRIASGKRIEERLSLALEGSEQALFDWDIAADRVYYSAKASELRGGPALAEEAALEAMRAYVHPDDIAGVLAGLEEAIRGVKPLYEAEYRVRHLDGRWIWLRSRGRVVERDIAGQALRLVGTDADISKRKAAEDELRQRAEFDALTGLPNRALFNDRMAGAMARAERSGKALAVLFVDIDHFKTVNDTHGHGAGDELLKIAAARLSAVVRGTDTVARLAGDEFTVILEGLGSVHDAQTVAAKLVEAVRTPMQIGGRSIDVSTSVGLAMFEPGEVDPSALLRRADEALYEAKRRGRDRYATRLRNVA